MTRILELSVLWKGLWWMCQGLCRKGWTACKNIQGLKAETGRLEELVWSPCPSPRADKAVSLDSRLFKKRTKRSGLSKWLHSPWVCWKPVTFPSPWLTHGDFFPNLHSESLVGLLGVEPREVWDSNRFSCQASPHSASGSSSDCSWVFPTDCGLRWRLLLPVSHVSLYPPLSPDFRLVVCPMPSILQWI